MTPPHKTRLSILLLILLVASVCAAGPQHNGFNLDNSLIPLGQIHPGGPAKNGIPAIDEAVFIKAQQADFLADDDRVIGLHLHGKARHEPRQTYSRTLYPGPQTATITA